jgi:hypothetical protein
MEVSASIEHTAEGEEEESSDAWSGQSNSIPNVTIYIYSAFGKFQTH